MKTTFTIISLAALSACNLAAQSADDLDEGIRVEHNPGLTLPYSVKWWARDNVCYFLIESENLKDWVFYPYGVVGSDGIEGIDLDITAERKFFILLGTDDSSLPPYVLDFDGDGINNGDELLSTALDPFVAQAIVDSDTDGLPDYWEEFYFGTGNLSKDGTADSDGDGISDKLEWQGRSNPMNNDSATPSLRKSFSYDDVGRLTDTTGVIEISFSFDEEGNLESAN